MSSKSIHDYFKPLNKDKKASKITGKRKYDDNVSENKDSESDEPLAKKQRLSKSKSNSSNNSNDSDDNNLPSNDNDNQIKTKSKNESSKTKTKSNDNNNNNNNDDNNETKFEEEEEVSDCDDNQISRWESEWKEILSSIDLSKLKYSESYQLFHPSWRDQLSNEFKKSYFANLRKELDKVEKAGKQIFPPVSQVFRCFELCPWNELRVVILGQDPYHDDDQAEGLCFSVSKGIKQPSSLKNMFKEALNDTVGFKPTKNGSLVEWAKQGVLLLNTVLTVTAHSANSHKAMGWQQFTDSVIRKISDSHNGVVFILWGGQARKKKTLINKKKHRIVESVHPSGLSASRGFYGSKPYSKTNDFLKELGKEPINWKISD